MANLLTNQNPIIKRLPYGVKAFGKYLLQLSAQIKGKCNYYFSEKMTKEEIVDKLLSLDIKKGSTLFVHSSLSRMGFVKGGANTVINAILEILGPEGTLVMPTFGWFPPILKDYVKEKPPVFDYKRSPSRLGVITETFRRRSGVLRSCHPTHSVAAYGPQAKFLVNEHVKSKTPFDSFSPYQKLLQLSANILCLGISIRFITFYHVYEDLNQAFPLQVYDEKPIRVRVVDTNGEYKIVTTYCHRPDLAKKRIDHNRRALVRVKKWFQKLNIIKEIKIGDRLSYLLNTKDINSALEIILKNGETIYEK